MARRARNPWLVALVLAAHAAVAVPGGGLHLLAPGCDHGGCAGTPAVDDAVAGAYESRAEGHADCPVCQYLGQSPTFPPAPPLPGVERRPSSRPAIPRTPPAPERLASAAAPRAPPILAAS